MTMKTCIKCLLQLPESFFHKDSRRPDLHYPYCKNCRREYSGQKKLPERQFRNCNYCGIIFSPRGTQIRENKNGVFFCCDAHMRKHREENATTYYHGYRKYILERDNGFCVLCGNYENLHVHHIKTRGSGGKDEYLNLVTLCNICHTTKAHGFNALITKEILEKYVLQFERPFFWDEVIEKSFREKERVKNHLKNQSRKYRTSLKNSSRYKEYKEKVNSYRKNFLILKKGLALSDSPNRIHSKSIV